MTTTRQWAADQARARAAQLRGVYAPLRETSPELATLGALRAEALETFAQALEAVPPHEQQPDVLPDAATLGHELASAVLRVLGGSVDLAMAARVAGVLRNAATRIDHQVTALEAAALKSALDHQEVLEREVRELRAERDLVRQRIHEAEERGALWVLDEYGVHLKARDVAAARANNAARICAEARKKGGE